MEKVPLSELEARISSFRNMMAVSNPEWEIAAIFSKINQYYFTGTMQDGMLIIPREGEPTLWVRRSYERSQDESLFPSIKPMKSFRDAKKEFKTLPDTVYLETEVVPLALYQRFNKHFPFKDFKPVDQQLATVRAVKSNYELSLMRKSGKIHQRVAEDLLPDVLQEGMSEADLAVTIFKTLVEEGHDGLTRFGMFDNEMVVGHVGFGDSSIYPTYFDGASGTRGLSPAAPVLGSRQRKLKKGDLVFVDVGCAFNGYNTDKTMTYMFGSSLPQHAIETHHKCVEIQNEIAKMLKPGAIPSQIYHRIMDNLDEDFLENFMGFGPRKVKFLGHAIGLLIDELPVIAERFDQPLQEGMVFAVEPKNGIAGVGMVGIENTFIVTPRGGECITGDNPGLVPVF
ncbi:MULTISPECIES: Xaa-Pro peptidase family protein [Methanobacterium]|uniref:Xaa-Pro aminopeptidase n=1 Tax=Methanobacterium formicicum TaxID=2162 RepID=A0A090I3B1_METFO|nr:MULTISPECIES: Xaa-Pro peptidase family protein [Methanobacterium]KUK75207.1 MAG: Xaa-Pro aminopeptidase [Methanobacterium sp. 42_16]MDH2659589.1 Xaa-Pro peptidase family protein [Methanobacterium formicicum]CEA13688.1 Xaa-Pro aminopeptidase [Methanobacterium formicicum]